MIKSVRIDPVKIQASGTSTDIKVPLFIQFDAAEIYEQVVKMGIDPSTITVWYVVQHTPGEYNTLPINLVEAVNTGHEVSTFAEIYIN